mmetsp:Transcript_83907/g.242371  ORF Transcript_83907/g.242371 Transcript_83907/m.242371 type:complete len:118 (-) Transcript_83907:296-649(-)
MSEGATHETSPVPEQTVELLEGSTCESPSTSGKPPSKETVTFDVAGRTFKVLKEPTLSLFPDSLLNTLAEERNSDEPIFVEANPDLFPYVLDSFGGSRMQGDSFGRRSWRVRSLLLR